LNAASVRDDLLAGNDSDYGFLGRKLPNWGVVEPFDVSPEVDFVIFVFLIFKRADEHLRFIGKQLILVAMGLKLPCRWASGTCLWP